MSAASPALRPAQGTLQWLGRALLPVIRWRVEGHLPEDPKFVVILAPHTSNWDLPIGLVCACALGLMTEYEHAFMVKDTVTKAPVIGPIVRWFGGIGVNRGAKFNAVDHMAEIFAKRERMMLAITPEGTRKRTEYWRSGFYHIARRAGVPVVPTYLDYGRRVGGIGAAIHLTGEIEADLDVMRRFYAPFQARHPELVGEIRFKAGDAARRA